MFSWMNRKRRTRAVDEDGVDPKGTRLGKDWMIICRWLRRVPSTPIFREARPDRRLMAESRQIAFQLLPQRVGRRRKEASESEGRRTTQATHVGLTTTARRLGGKGPAAGRQAGRRGGQGGKTGKEAHRPAGFSRRNRDRKDGPLPPDGGEGFLCMGTRPKPIPIPPNGQQGPGWRISSRCAFC